MFKDIIIFGRNIIRNNNFKSFLTKDYHKKKKCFGPIKNVSLFDANFDFIFFSLGLGKGFSLYRGGKLQHKSGEIIR